MSRVEHFADGVMLYHGDCLEVMADLEPVDHCISDPPFEAEAHTLQRRKLGKTLGSDREIVSAPLNFDAITSEQRTDVARRVSALSKGWALVFCQAEAVSDWRVSFEEAGASYRRAMVWIKPDGMPQYSGDRPGMGYESIVAAWCGGGRSAWNGGGKHGVFTFNKGEGGGPAPHPTTKPQPLMRTLISLFSKAGETILDPFAGSASTGVACLNLGRKFIGVEKNQAYFDIACRRLEDAASRPDMFTAAPRAKAVQEALL